MASKYTHLELDQDVYSIAGYYTPRKELRLRYGDREVLYVVGQTVIESSCCAAGSWNYAMVPGYILRWQGETNEAGLPVSEVEPITDKEARKDIDRIIKEVEGVLQVDFR